MTPVSITRLSGHSCFRLELVDPSENIAQLLLPEGGDENSWETSMVIFSQSHLVQLPNTQCDNCYLK